jgi:hypothetical protein
MAAVRRLGFMAGIFLAATLATGCNPLYLPFFIFGPEPKVPAELKQIGSKEKRKEVSVVVLTYAGPDTRPEFIKVDRDLANLITKELRAAFEANEEKVKVISTSKVEKFKQEHPNWTALDLAEIGKQFNADYVIYVEVNGDSLTLYERGSGRELYRGHADGTITLVNVHEPEDGTDHKSFNYDYPNDAKAVQASDNSVILFKQAFLSYVARRVAWCFAAHPTKDKYVED